jgi:hypothetical protein
VETSRLIRNPIDLVGTCYFEFSPGEYQGCHWNEGSVSLDEETFGLIEPFFARRIPQFDHRGFVNVTKPIWHQLIAELDRLAQRIEPATVDDLRKLVGPAFDNVQEKFAEGITKNSRILALSIRDLTKWLTEQLHTRETISILRV